MSDLISQMRERSFDRASALAQPAKTNDLAVRAESARPPHPLEPDATGFDVIAEVKLASPSRGRLIFDESPEDIVALARAYEASGAAAISVLTEASRFGGSIDHLGLVASVVTIPVVRKDFLVDPIQVLEARAYGASGVLLIARMLDGALLEEMTDITLRLGMFALIEVFDRADLEMAERVFDRDVLVGVNARDLRTMDVDGTRLASLAPHLPAGVPAVAESGINSSDDISAAVSLGYRLALVGTALVTSQDPGSTLRRLLAAGRVSTQGVRS